MELSIQERLKDLRVERGLTLEQLAEETHLSKSALGSYEGDDLKDISHHALIQQVINGHFINLCQLDKGMVADVLEIVPLVTA